MKDISTGRICVLQYSETLLTSLAFQWALVRKLLDVRHLERVVMPIGLKTGHTGLWIVPSTIHSKKVAISVLTPEALMSTVSRLVDALQLLLLLASTDSNVKAKKVIVQFALNLQNTYFRCHMMLSTGSH